MAPDGYTMNCTRRNHLSVENGNPVPYRRCTPS